MGGEPRSRAARRGALLREGRTGCQGRQPRGNERSDNLMAGRPQQPSTDSDKRSTVSCGTSFATPCGRPLRGRAPSLLLRCHESRTGCQGGQPRGNYEARRTWQDAPDRVASVSSEPKRSFAGREALLRESRTGCQGGQPRGNYEAGTSWQDARNNRAPAANAQHRPA